MRERSLTVQILRYLNSRPGVRARKLHGGPFSSGWPDILCVKNGIVYFLEVKRPGETPTALQQQELLAWRQSGASAEIVTSLARVQELGL